MKANVMKKSVALTALAALAATGGAAHAELKGQAEVVASFASVSAPYEDSAIQWASVLLDLDEGYKLGFSVTNVDAWGDHARYFNVRAVTPVSENMWFDTNVGASDRAAITAGKRLNTMFNVKFPQHSLIVGAGADYYDMRGGGSATSVKGHAVYYVPGMPLVLQGDATVTRASVNDRMGYRVGVAATYGRVGEWTAALRMDTGRAHYELERFPGAVADYKSHHVAATLRYWVDKDWGVSVGASRVDNRYYERNEARAGLFWSF